MPFRNAALTDDAYQPNRLQAIAIDSEESTRTNGSWWESVQFWFSLDDHDATMPPRETKPNWQLILTIVSMCITVLTLLVAGTWAASNKSTNLDAVTTIITNNTSEIKAANVAIIDLKLDIKGLKDANDELSRQIAELRVELQSKKEK